MSSVKDSVSKKNDKKSETVNSAKVNDAQKEPPRGAIALGAIIGCINNVSFWLCVFFMVLVQGNDGAKTENSYNEALIGFCIVLGLCLPIHVLDLAVTLHGMLACLTF